jgi:hypothetical protein
MSFAPGFRPKFAIAVKKDYMDLFDLSNPASFNYITGAGQGGNTSANFTLTISASQIGLTNGMPASFRLFGTYTSSTAYRSTEAIAGNDANIFNNTSQGSIPFTNTAFVTYNFAAPATPSYPVTFQVDMSVQIADGSFNPNAGDTVYAAGTFQTNPWTGFQLNPSVGNTNIYTAVYPDQNLTNTVEQFKFKFHSVTTNLDVFDDDLNRLFTLKSGGQTLPLVYFNYGFPVPSTVTNNLTLSVDMGPQIYLGHFNPGTMQIEAFGTFTSPKWSTGIVMTNNPTAVNSNVFLCTIPDGNYSGGFEQFKFVIVNGGNTYESTANRTFYTPTNAGALPLAYFNHISSYGSAPITFQVDMTVPLEAGTFSPANGDILSVAGTFQTNTWSPGICVLTNSAVSTNIYYGTFLDLNQPGIGEAFKFQIMPSSLASTNWENSGDRFFLLGSTALTNPLVLWSNLDPHNAAPTATLVTFTVDMTGAVDDNSVAFDVNNDLPLVDGDFTSPQWQVMNNATDPTVLGDYSSYFLNRVGNTMLFTNSFLVPAGNALQLSYKYGILHNSGNINTSTVDNEAPFGQNHVRFIRALGSYNLPTDIFGQQHTNQAAATEPSFGNLAIGRLSGGTFPISWLGRPGVHLQYTTNLVNSAWIDVSATDGGMATNWPSTSSGRYFRLVNP